MGTDNDTHEQILRTSLRNYTEIRVENLVWILGQKGVYVRNPVALPH